MEKIRLAIVGSCPSRDPFNSKFGTGYKDFYEVVMTHFQMSMISSMSKPTVYDHEKLVGVNPAKVMEVEADLNKTLIPRLKSKAPEYLIMDFWADQYFGAVRLSNGNYVTNNQWRIKKLIFSKNNQNLHLLRHIRI